MVQMITALAGGVGASLFLRGLLAVVPEKEVAIIANTADDAVVHGLAVSPDLDTITYTLAGVSDPQQGWGLAGETWNALASLERYGAETWFRLGDKDIGTHLYRTQRKAHGAPLSAITAEITSAWGIESRLLPMTDDRVETRLTLVDGSEVSFQEYFVHLRHDPPVKQVRFDGSASARPGPGVLAALAGAHLVIVCPSNPLLSVAPILSVPGIEAALTRRRDSVVAISPIVGGRALRGPADHLMEELGYEPSVKGVARLYSPFAAALVIDDQDASSAAEVSAEGMRCITTNTIMDSTVASEALARTVIGSFPGARDEGGAGPQFDPETLR